MQDSAMLNTNSTHYSFTTNKRILVRFLIVGSLLLGFSPSTFSQSTDELFEHYEFVTDLTNSQTVVTGFFLGGATAELAIIYSDESNNPHVKMYGFNGDGWLSLRDETLSPEIQFIDVANIGGRDRLITYQSGLLSWFDPSTGTERELVSVTSSFQSLRDGEIPHVDITHDLNGDDRDDLVVPDVNGFWVLVQMSDGNFADPVQIGPDTDFSGIYGADGYRYDTWSQSRVYELDYNHDGRNDLVYWSEDHFEVHQQDEGGIFTVVSETFTTEVDFDSDDVFLLAEGDMTGRVLHSIADLNNDAVGDLVIHSLEGASISEKRSTYEVHFGAPTPDGGTAFALEVGITFQSDGNIQLGMERNDFDGDGQVDLVFTTIKVEYLSSSRWKRWKHFWGEDIWLDLEFYQMEGGRYRETPNATRRFSLVAGPIMPGWVPLDLALRGGMHESLKTQVRTIIQENGFGAALEDWRRMSGASSSSYPHVFNMIVQLGDVTGDGLSELFIGKNTPDGLDVFFGEADPSLFSRRSRDVPVHAPNDQEFTWLVDLNKDGKQDILMHHPFTRKDPNGRPTQAPGAEVHRVTILIAR